MKKIKKVISMLLILTLIGVNFMPLLNVKAEGTTITTNDNNCKGNSCYVTNTATLTVWGVNDDTFSAYKVLDTYYNKSTNQFSYSFTSDFVNFKNDSNYSNYVVAEGKTIGNLTIDDYFNLTSDNASLSMSYTSSTLNKLVSRYANYIRTNNITGVEMTTSDGQASASVVTGAYVILPDDIKSFMGDTFHINTYGVMVGNVVFNVENDQWILKNLEINSKYDYSTVMGLMVEPSPSEVIELLTNGYDDFLPEQDIEVNSGKDFTYALMIDPSDVPSNALEANKINGKAEINFPKGISYDLSKSYFGMSPLTIRDDKVYTTIEEQEMELADIVIEDQKITLSFSENYNGDGGWFFAVRLNDDVSLGRVGENPGNTITSKLTYLKDPYVENSFDTLDYTNTAYSYGVKVDNKDTNNNILAGSEFTIYSDETLENEVGTFTSNSEGKAIFKGVKSGTFYVKQTKAPAGYKLASEVAEITISDEAVDSDGYYNLSVTNSKQGFLPSTGGIGTVIYTFIGLLIIAMGSIAFISYKKKNIVNTNN